MMYYVERANGAIIALYANPQDGRTDPDPLPDTHPEVVAFFNPPPALDDYRQAVQAHVDTTAQERRYDGGHTCATYVGSTNPVWAAEATAFVAWRDAVWIYAFGELAKVETGLRPQPTIEEFLGELPTISWPE